MTRHPDLRLISTDPGILGALERIAPPPTQADWAAYLEGNEMPKPQPIDLPDDHVEARFLRVRTGGNLHLSWWQRQAPVDRALLTMTATVCVAALALVAWQVWP